MRCIQCGRELAEGARFCPFCGTQAASAAPVDDAPLYQAEVKGLLKSGTLTVYRDRTEFTVSNVQKMTFRYASMAALKKGLDRINFIMEDGRTESCAVNRKNLHEAFYTIEQASRPYLAERRQRLQAAGIRLSFPGSRSDLSGMLGSGMLDFYDDRCEYRTPSGKGDTVRYEDVKAVRLSAIGALEFTFYDGTKKAFTADKEQREEALAFLQAALLPFIEARKARLLEQGIHFCFLTDPGSGRGVLNIFDDRLEYTSEAGPDAVVCFSDIRAVHVFDASLETALTDGTSRVFPIDKDARDEVLAFLNKAIAPFVELRTSGFDIRFGTNETLEINAARGVFHVLRQDGREISDEYALSDITRAEAVENKVTGGLVNALLAARGGEGAKPEERIADIGVLLTVQTEQGEGNVPVCFGSFSFGVERTGAEYARYAGQVTELFAWLEAHCPACERVPLPPPPEPEASPDEAPSAPAESAGTEAPVPAGEPEPRQFGALIDGIAGYVGQCSTPMTIAIQGDWTTGQGSFLHLLHDGLAAQGDGSILWLYTWQFSQFDLGEQLPMLLADKLIELLGAGGGEQTKARAKMVAKGMIGLVSGFISQGASDGQQLADALIRNNAAASLEQKVRLFGDLVRRRTETGTGKVIFFVDDLNRLAPAKVVQLLDALRCFFDCSGCVFMAAVDRETVLRGLREIYGADYSEEACDAWFDRLFRTSFRVPQSSFDAQKYIRESLARVGLPADAKEAECCEKLTDLSVGSNPKALERVFDAFLLLKNLADPAVFADGACRRAVFGLLCMQGRFPGMYRCLVQSKDVLTPAALSALAVGSPLEEQAGLSEAERPPFRAFAAALCAAVSAGGDGVLNKGDCRAFARALAASAITASK